MPSDSKSDRTSGRVDLHRNDTSTSAPRKWVLDLPGSPFILAESMVMPRCVWFS